MVKKKNSKFIPLSQFKNQINDNKNTLQKNDLTSSIVTTNDSANNNINKNLGESMTKSDHSSASFLKASSKAETKKQQEEEQEQHHHCFICTEEIRYFAVGPCNHRVCHVCNLRLRALYKVKSCAYCKVNIDQAVFTKDPEKPFEDYNLYKLPYKDEKLYIFMDSEEIHEEVMNLLKFNCPDTNCEFVSLSGWKELKDHIKKKHGKVLCDICTKNKKLFTHEHNMYTNSELHEHIRKGDLNDKSFKGHPLCGFCKLNFYGNDELYEHCRQKHEECFICQKMGRRHQYYDNYNSLEKHFNKDHYICSKSECLEKKFVVFGTEIDLKAHEAEEHNMHGGSKRGIHVELNFNYSRQHESNRPPSASRTEQQSRGKRNLANRPANYGKQLSVPEEEDQSPESASLNINHRLVQSIERARFANDFPTLKATVTSPNTSSSANSLSVASKYNAGGNTINMSSAAGDYRHRNGSSSYNSTPVETVASNPFPPLPAKSNSKKKQPRPSNVSNPSLWNASNSSVDNSNFTSKQLKSDIIASSSGSALDDPDISQRLQLLLKSDKKKINKFKRQWIEFKENRVADIELLENLYELAKDDRKWASDNRRTVEQVGKFWNRFVESVPESSIEGRLNLKSDLLQAWQDFKLKNAANQEEYPSLQPANSSTSSTATSSWSVRQPSAPFQPKSFIPKKTQPFPVNQQAKVLVIKSSGPKKLPLKEALRRTNNLDDDIFDKIASTLLNQEEKSSSSNRNGDDQDVQFIDNNSSTKTSRSSSHGSLEKLSLQEQQEQDFGQNEIQEDHQQQQKKKKKDKGKIVMKWG